MLTSFTRNYQDNSTEAGFQFTFYCDICNDGYRSSFIESETYKKGKLFSGIGRGASALGSLLGGGMSRLGYGADRAADILGERFEGRSPEWQKEHEQAFDLSGVKEAATEAGMSQPSDSQIYYIDLSEPDSVCGPGKSRGHEA